MPQDGDFAEEASQQSASWKREEFMSDVHLVDAGSPRERSGDSHTLQHECQRRMHMHSTAPSEPHISQARLATSLSSTSEHRVRILHVTHRVTVSRLRIRLVSGSLFFYRHRLSQADS